MPEYSLEIDGAELELALEQWLTELLPLPLALPLPLLKEVKEAQGDGEDEEVVLSEAEEKAEELGLGL
jgi:hypothetical protein